MLRLDKLKEFSVVQGGKHLVKGKWVRINDKSVRYIQVLNKGLASEKTHYFNCGGYEIVDGKVQTPSVKVEREEKPSENVKVTRVGRAPKDE